MQACAEAPSAGRFVRVMQTGEVGRIKAVDTEWAELYPHKGPMLILDISNARKCYSLMELESLSEDYV